MLDRKKVVSDQGLAGLQDGDSKSTATTSKTGPKQMGPARGLNNLRTLLQTQKQLGGNSMMNLVKTKENQGAGAAEKAAKKAPQSPTEFKQAAANWQLFDLSADYGETTDVAAQHPTVVAELIAKHDAWWKECRPLMVNENIQGPAENPFKVMYREQTGK